MRRRPANLPLLIGLVVSLVFHAVLLPPLVAAMSAERDQSSIAARFEPDDFTPPEEEPPPDDEQREVELGIDARTPSTLTWIGYEEYEKHLTEIGMIDQAAFRDEPAGDLAPPGGARSGPPPQPALPEAADAARAETAAAEQPPPADRPQDDAAAAASPPPPALQAPFDDAALATVTRMLGGVALDDPSRRSQPVLPTERDQNEAPEDQASPSDTPREQPNASSAERTMDRIQRLLAEAKREAERRVAQAAPNEAQPQRSQNQPADQPRDARSENQPEPGDQADKESDPTSVIEVPLDQVELGRPVARQGLELKPQRPEFTRLMKATASPGNPLVQISFGRDGRPRDARVLVGSGDSRIDHAIEVSLYRWRATGEQLESLTGEQLLDVRLRIILNPRR
jgi:hypothetical protein